MLSLFRYFKPNSPTAMVDGVTITGYNSVSWIERYQEAGEFEIEGTLGDNLLEQLPLGSIVGHTDTFELMVVEDHSISESKDGSTKVKVTGRSLPIILDFRILGINQNWDLGYKQVSEIALVPNYSWNQIVQLINAHIASGFTQNAQDAIPNLRASTNVTGVGESVRRVLKRGSIYSTVKDLLKPDDLGIRTIRAHRFTSNFYAADAPTTARFLIHKGRDVSGSVQFSSETGEIDQADYFWTERKHKNAAIVVGDVFEVLVEGQSPPASGFNRRILNVDGGDIDGVYDEGMSQAQLNEIITSMQTLGKQALADQRSVSLAAVDVSRNGRYSYRKDYDIGDLVGVRGTYGPEVIMRVIEHVETENETEFVSYPTLAAV